MKHWLGKLIANGSYLRPILVVGAGRSGTSILQRALGRHPLIMPTMGEGILIARLGGVVDYLENGDSRSYRHSNLKAGKDAVYETFRRLCFESVVGQDYGFMFIQKTLLRDLIRRRDILKLRSVFSWRHWCAKAFPTSSDYNGLIELFPELKSVYIIRSGIDVVQSRTQHPAFSSRSFSEHCESWKSHIDKYRYLSKIESAIEIRQEQLTAAPESLFQRVFDFLGVSHHEAPIEFVRTTLVSQLDNRRQEGVDVKQLMEERNPAYEDWSQEQRETFKRICSATMNELGYEMRF